MSFTFTDRHVTDFYHHGYTVFREVVPAALITDMRRAGGRVEEVTRRDRGKNAARTSPIAALAGEVDIKPFRDYVELPALVDAVKRVLTPEHDISDLQTTAMFLTYLVGPSCQDWHRDLAGGYVGIDDDEEWKVVSTNPTFFAQINCALYTDTCLWYVPGSAGRPNTPGELGAAGPPYDGKEGRGRLIDPDLVGKSDAEGERLCLDYCRRMPGGVNLVLEPGDFALYRPIGWHTGNYAPYRRRMTLHHTAWSPPTRAWYARWFKRREAALDKPAAVAV
jgi:ectoine hydroxylase-related dioxygenase (phytanoyl-CoA dioxygenase family)